MYDKGRGAALADFNQDGLLDLIQVNLDTPVRVWRNVGVGTAEAPVADGQLARAPAERSRAATATRSGRSSRRRSARRCSDAS